MSFTDGCKAQYKKYKNFANLASQGRRNEEEFGMPADWHFFATAHGKGENCLISKWVILFSYILLLGAYDGIGGTLKREATRYSLRQPYKNHILTAKEF